MKKYKDSKKKFEDEVKKEKDRVADFGKLLFEKALKIPKVIKPPTRPSDIAGPRLALNDGGKTGPVAWPAAATGWGYKAYLRVKTSNIVATYPTYTNTAAGTVANKLAYLRPCKSSPTVGALTGVN